MRVHQLLKIVRVAQGGITHTRLGECAGIGQQSVTAFENGRASLSRKTLCAMASRLGISEASPCRKASLMTVSEDEEKENGQCRPSAAREGKGPVSGHGGEDLENAEA